MAGGHYGMCSVMLQAVSDIGAEVRIWAIPIVLAAVAGGVAAATIGWAVGGFFIALAMVACGVLYAVTNSRVRARREERGNPAKRTAKILRRLRARGHRVMDARLLPEGQGGEEQARQLDHLVVGPGGVYALTSKKWRRQIPMRVRREELFHGPSSQGHVVEEARGAARRAADVLRSRLGRPVDVVPALVVHDAPVPWAVLRIKGVDVLSGKRLRRYLVHREWGLSPVDVERIAAAAEEALPQRTAEGITAAPGPVTRP